MHRGGRARGPEPERVDVAAAPAGDRRVMRDRQHPFGGIPQAARRASVTPPPHAYSTPRRRSGSEYSFFGRSKAPGFDAREPALRQFVLPAVPDFLHEQAMLVADAASRQAGTASGHAYCCCPAQAAKSSQAGRRYPAPRRAPACGVGRGPTPRLAGQPRARSQAGGSFSASNSNRRSEFDEGLVHALVACLRSVRCSRTQASGRPCDAMRAQ